MNKIETLLACLPKSNYKQNLVAEIESMRQQLAESQAREARLREALKVVISFALSDDCACDTDDLCYEFRMAANALALPDDDTTLREIIAKAGEVMRERCAKFVKQNLYSNKTDIEAIHTLPIVTLEDLK